MLLLLCYEMIVILCAWNALAFLLLQEDCMIWMMAIVLTKQSTVHLLYLFYVDFLIMTRLVTFNLYYEILLYNYQTCVKYIK
jgi:hypothetical protein